MNEEVKGPYFWGGSPLRKIHMPQETKKWRRIMWWCFSVCAVDGLILLIDGMHDWVGGALAIVFMLSLIAGRYAQRRFVRALGEVERMRSSARRRAFMEWLRQLRR